MGTRLTLTAASHHGPPPISRGRKLDHPAAPRPQPAPARVRASPLTLHALRHRALMAPHPHGMPPLQTQALQTHFPLRDSAVGTRPNPVMRCLRCHKTVCGQSHGSSHLDSRSISRTFALQRWRICGLKRLHFGSAHIGDPALALYCRIAPAFLAHRATASYANAHHSSKLPPTATLSSPMTGQCTPPTRQCFPCHVHGRDIRYFSKGTIAGDI